MNTHESAQRLAAALQELDPSARIDPTYMAARLNESPQVITNWRARGVSKEGAISAQRTLGVSCTWVLDGLEPKLVRQSQPARITAKTMAEGWDLAKLVAEQTTGSDVLKMPRDAHLLAQSINSVIERQEEASTPPKIDIGGIDRGKRTGKVSGSGKPAGEDVVGGESEIKARRKANARG